MISGPTTIDKCGSVDLNIFSSLYLLNDNNFTWKYTFNNISNELISSNNNPQLFISNNALLNITNNDNNINYTDFELTLYNTNLKQHIIITMDKLNIFPSIYIDGGTIQTIYIGHKNQFNIIPNVYYSQCLNSHSVSLLYQWKCLNISNTSTYSKMLEISPNKLQPEKHYIYELTVFVQTNNNYSYKATQNVTIYTDYATPKPLANAIKTIHRNEDNIISMFDLFTFPNISKDIMQNIYQFQWFCYNRIEETDAWAKIQNCSNVIQMYNKYEIILNNDFLSTENKFELMISRNNKSVSSEIIYHYLSGKNINNDNTVELELLSPIPSIINPLQTVHLSICIHKIFPDLRENDLHWTLTLKNDKNDLHTLVKYDNYIRELLISNVTNINYYHHIFANSFEYIEYSPSQSCPMQTNLYFNIISLNDVICDSDNEYNIDSTLVVTFSAKKSRLLIEIDFANKPFDGMCNIIVDNNDKYVSSSPVALYTKKYNHLFNYVKASCYNYQNNNENELYYNFMSQDNIYLFDDWMFNSWIELPLFIQVQNYTLYGLVNNEFGYFATDSFVYTSQNMKKKSQFHILTDDLIDIIDNDLSVSIATNNYKLSYIIITSFLDVIKYGINQYDFVNEKDTISLIFDDLIAHLLQLQTNASLSYYSSYLYKQIVSILHSFMNDPNSIILTYINPQNIIKILELLVVHDSQFTFDKCYIYKIFDIMSSLIKIQSLSVSVNTEITELIINEMLYVSYLYLQNGFIGEYIDYLNDIMKIESILAYTKQNNYQMCKHILEFTNITEYNLDTIICIKMQFFEQNMFSSSNPNHIEPITVANLISTNDFELLYDDNDCSWMTIWVNNSYNNSNIMSSDDDNYMNYPICEYWDYNTNEWIHNNKYCWISNYNISNLCCSCQFKSNFTIINIKQEDIYINRNISEYFEIQSLNMMSISTPILYIVICFSLLGIAFILLIPETNDNIPLWIEQKQQKQQKHPNGSNNSLNLIKDEMGAIYVIYQTNTPFQRCSNLYCLNMRNNWCITEMFCRIDGTNYKTKERILLSYLYIITIMALNTLLFQNIYNYKDNKTFNAFVPFIMLSIIALIPIIIFQYILKTIEPVNFNKLLYEISITKINNNNTNSANSIQKSLSAQSAGTDILAKLYSQISKHEQEERIEESDLNSSYNSDSTNSLTSENLNSKTPTNFRIQIEEIEFDPNYKWILDPNRSSVSPVKTNKIVDITVGNNIRDIIPHTNNNNNNDNILTNKHNFIWFTSICQKSIKDAEKESEITRETFDNILSESPIKFRDKIYSICNIDKESFIVFEDYLEFVYSILIATNQYDINNLSQIDNLKLEFRDMTQIFMDKVNIDKIFLENKYVNQTTFGLSISGAAYIISELRDVNTPMYDDIAICLLNGLTKSNIKNSIMYCTKIFWKILSNEWWLYDMDDQNESDTSLDDDQNESDTITHTITHENELQHLWNSTPTKPSMNAPKPMRINTLMIDDEDIDMDINNVNNNNDDDYHNNNDTLQIGNVVNQPDLDLLYPQKHMIPIIKKYYTLPFGIRKYIWCLIVVVIIILTIITVIFGVYLDYKHYFENNDKMNEICDSQFIPKKIDFIQYNITQSIVNSKNKYITTNDNDTQLVLLWLFIIFIQLIMFVFIFQPLYIAILTINQHYKYKYQAKKVDVNGNEHDNRQNLISFFSK